MYSVVRQASQVSAGADGCWPEMANAQTATDRESGEERLQNGVMNVREERRLWHRWVVWEMREWFDSREQDVPIRWIYFPRTDRRLRRLRITHSLHPLFPGHNRAKLHSTYESFIIPELKQAAANCPRPPWLCACACSVPLPFRTVPGTGCGVTAATVIKSTNYEIHGSAKLLRIISVGKLTPDISQKLLNLEDNKAFKLSKPWNSADIMNAAWRRFHIWCCLGHVTSVWDHDPVRGPTFKNSRAFGSGILLVFCTLAHTHKGKNTKTHTHTQWGRGYDLIYVAIKWKLHMKSAGNIIWLRPRLCSVFIRL